MQIDTPTAILVEVPEQNGNSVLYVFMRVGPVDFATLAILSSKARSRKHYWR